jgi:hypothetical protein
VRVEVAAMTPRAKWIWQGSPGHFIAGESCIFHLSTVIGGYIISTVGEYCPLGPYTKIETIGCDRLYETMAFRAARCVATGCTCGEYRQASGKSLDFAPANTRAEAHETHMAMCAKWAKRKPRKMGGRP